MSERFYVEAINPDELTRIAGSEARHIARVMRMGPGDQVILFDGHNRQCVATIESVQKNDVLLRADNPETLSREATVRIAAGVALPKGDRQKFLVEKLTETGVAELFPIVCTRSNVIPRDNTVEKIRRYVIESSKQCGRNLLMKIHDPMPINEFFERPDPTALSLCCSPTGETGITNALASYSPDHSCGDTPSVWFCIGPEGGLTNDEIANATRANWLPVSLGERVLRTETAAIASCVTALALLNQ